MIIYNNFIFLTDASSSTESEIFYVPNNKENTLTIQLSGESPSGVVLKILGLTDVENGDWTELAGISLSDYSIKTYLSLIGIYQYDIEGIKQIKISLDFITSGSITVFGVTTKE